MILENNNRISSSKFWNDCYDNDDTGWDLGAPTPIFIDWCNNLKSKKKICIPGCGNGYDALYFASKGHQVTAIDFAKEPTEKLKKESKNNNLNIDVIQKDIFDLSLNLNNEFDYVVEYTFYCAIDPKMRHRYIDVMYQLLKPGGELTSILLPLDKNLRDGGPPFGVKLNETIEMFSEKFELIESVKHPLSIAPRSDRERFVRFIK